MSLNQGEHNNMKILNGNDIKKVYDFKYLGSFIQSKRFENERWSYLWKKPRYHYNQLDIVVKTQNKCGLDINLTYTKYVDLFLPEYNMYKWNKNKNHMDKRFQQMSRNRYWLNGQ